jgi:hypothetical protein
MGIVSEADAIFLIDVDVDVDEIVFLMLFRGSSQVFVASLLVDVTGTGVATGNFLLLGL